MPRIQPGEIWRIALPDAEEHEQTVTVVIAVSVAALAISKRHKR